VARADSALYEAKRTGRNRVVLAAAEDDEEEESLPEVRVSSIPESVEASVEAALLRELASERAGLPLLPRAAAEALRLAEDPRTSMAHIARLVERDPPLAARFLAIAGSAAYSRGLQASSMQVALVRIGLAASRDLLLQVVYERSNRDLSRYQVEVAHSFDHSVWTGIAARTVARELRVSFDNAYLCGLLHDIGEARIYRILARLPDAPGSGDFLKALVDAHHTRAGTEVAMAWKLPRDVVEVCAHHHTPGGVGGMPVLILRAAEALVDLIERGQFNPRDAMSKAQSVDLEPVVFAGIRPDRLPALLTEVIRQIGLHRDAGGGVNGKVER
jgi:putative nucleotidyltransferase with HDIG domain